MNEATIKNFVLRNVIFILLAGFFAATSFFFIHKIPCCISFLILDTVYLYLLLLLVSVCLLSSKKNPIEKFCIFWLPSRLAGMFLFILFVTTMVYCWANIYFSIGNDFKNPITKEIDAVYFSYITMATVGYGDIVPVSDHAKELVMYQISGSILLFFGAFPLLVSRLSTFNK